MPPVRLASLPLLFKQAAPSSSSPPLHHALCPLRQFRTSAPPAARVAPRKASRTAWRPKQTPEPQPRSGASVANFFEQEAATRGAKRRRIGNPDDDLAPLAGDLQQINRDIGALENDIKKDKIPTEASEEEAQMWFSDEERQKIQQSMIDNLPSFGIMPHHVRPTEGMSKSALLFLGKLNEALDGASLDAVNDKARTTLWRYYERTKIYVPDLVSRLPDQAWQLLWTSQSEETIGNPNRTDHLKTLTQDMEKAGKILTDEQKIARLEGIFWSGKQDEALSDWEAGLKKGDARNTSFLELGIRMYAYDRNVKRATELVDVLYKLHPDADPRVLLQVISASIGIGETDNYRAAWDLYLLFRRKLNTDVTMEDYDAISLDFLRAGQRVHALAVFRDMMLAGEITKPKSAYRNAVDRLTSFMSSSEDAAEVNSLGLESLTILPRRFQNKFFYASWMKKLIGMGEVEAAAQVFDLMYERGVNPDAKHANGLISAYLRGGYKPARRTAEQMGWAMIQARLDFVRARRESAIASLSSIHDFEALSGASKPLVPAIDKARPVPRATIETFSLLAQYYLRRSAFANVRHLRNLLAACEIPMNSYFMNHLLYAEFRNRTHREVWARFQVMSRTVTPDFETFSCLWECMKPHVDPAVNKDDRGFPDPRHLMKIMIAWFQGLKGQQLRDARQDMEIDTYNDIIRCFCLARDPAGSFVAVQALKQTFGLTPQPKTVRMLILQIARLGLFVPSNHKEARKITASQESEENITRTARVLDVIAQMRSTGYEDRGYRVEDLDEQQQQDEQHRTVLQLLYTVVKQLHAAEGGEADATALIATAAEEMNVDELDIEGAMGLVV